MYLELYLLPISLLINISTFHLSLFFLRRSVFILFKKDLYLREIIKNNNYTISKFINFVYLSDDGEALINLISQYIKKNKLILFHSKYELFKTLKTIYSESVIVESEITDLIQENVVDRKKVKEECFASDAYDISYDYHKNLGYKEHSILGDSLGNLINYNELKIIKDCINSRENILVLGDKGNITQTFDFCEKLNELRIFKNNYSYKVVDIRRVSEKESLLSKENMIFVSFDDDVLIHSLNVKNRVKLTIEFNTVILSLNKKILRMCRAVINFQR